MACSGNKSYVHTPSNEPFVGLTMHELLEERVKKHPDREMHVFVSDNKRLTFAEYRDKVVDLAGGFLVKLCLRKGDCVAVMGANHVEWPLIAGAARAIGVIVVGLQIGNTHKTLKATMQKISCKALFILRSPDTLYSDACKMIPELSTSTPGHLQSKEFPTLKMVISSIDLCSGTMDFDDIYLPGSEDRVNEVARTITSDDISHMCMTSGSTGIPKLVPMTHFQVLHGSMFRPIQSNFDQNQVTRLICTGNLAYTAAIQISQVATLMFGATAVFASPNYNFEKFLQAIQKERCTHFFFLLYAAVDLAYDSMVDSYDLSSLRSGYVGGSPIASSVFSHLTKKLGIPVMNMYGSTEVNSACGMSPDDSFDTYSTVGRPLTNVEIQIVDGNQCPVPVGEIGDVWIRSPMTFDGYYGDVEKTRLTINKSGWVMLGDVGKLDYRGYLTLIGRKKDVILRRGLNVHPSVIEHVLLMHPSVMDARVVAIPDYRIGEEVCACIRLNVGQTLSEEDLLTFCIDKISTMEMPTYVLMFDVFPLGTTGKVDRKKLKEMAIHQIPIPEPPSAQN